ncbi:piggyBac transposable element-derived protein 4 [Biomphalaria pfeifferi]|uniref:PiggyBac transposable element-derived protein 4 n=1 Tax=Biomphalaria pfeifferi TaxID=112525 RepID=A0AAD8CCK7_BIOPF|nr:piggyBac transposable element-derived protein 4 [Biomphalaria pfeifferi]
MSSDSEVDFPNLNKDNLTDEEFMDSDLDEDLSESDEAESFTPSAEEWRPVDDHDCGPRPVLFTAHPGPKHAPAPDAKPVDYVNLFLTDDIVNLVVNKTNKYTRQFIEDNHENLETRPRSRVHKWTPISNEEFRAFLGVTMNMGLNKKPNYNAYWDSCNLSQETPWFPVHMNRDRYQIILKFLHFPDNMLLPDRNDIGFKLFKVQELIKHFNAKFKYFYHPTQNVSIDESMIGFKGKTPHIRQFMPNKRHARFGIKMWCLSDSANGYLCQFEIYEGSQGRRIGNGRTYTHELIIRLMTAADLLNRGHHLGIDNFFTSIELLEELFSENTTATGTVRSNRKGLPDVCVKTKLKNKELIAARKGNLLCLAYQDNSRKPILLSTASKAGLIDTVNSRKQPVTRPAVIHAYNQAMGGVDLGDEKLYMYIAERRSLKWTNKVFFSQFGRAILNSYIIYHSNTSDRPKLSRYNFIVSALESMTSNFVPQKVIRRKRTRTEMEAAQMGPTLLTQTVAGHPLDGHDLSKLPVGKKRQCVAGHPTRVRTGWECTGCKVGLCPECFAKYHRQL